LVRKNRGGARDAENKGSGSQGSSNRVNRGGSFDNAASNARSANRNNDTPENADNNLGLRPVKASQCPIAVIQGPPRRARDAQTRFLRRLPRRPNSTAQAGVVGPTPSLPPCPFPPGTRKSFAEFQ
jgi:hypothetical protein